MVGRLNIVTSVQHTNLLGRCFLDFWFGLVFLRQTFITVLNVANSILSLKSIQKCILIMKTKRHGDRNTQLFKTACLVFLQKVRFIAMKLSIVFLCF